jgi:hypothetical protein
MEPIKIKVLKDFSPTPGPRYVKEGANSGELFRQNILFPAFQKALQEGRKVIVDLDGAKGYGTSFLEESFGGLIRVEKMDYKTVKDNLEIISDEQSFLKDDIYKYLEDAAQKPKR